ncbi:MAG: phage major capsid protein, partial [Bacteroidaceae bacterium]|nr:phage major capsid protein [Bacteroidaceae bacterium]
MKKKFVTVADVALKLDGATEEQKIFMNTIAQVVCDVVNKSREGELSPEEVQEKFNGINEQLKSYDAEKFTQIVKDNEDLCEQVKQLGETVKKLQAKGLSMEVINKFDEKVGKMLDSEKFRDFVNGLTTKSGAFDGFSLKEVSMASNYTGDVLISQQTDKVVSAVSNKKLHMRNVIATLQGDPEFPQLTYAQVYDFDRNAEFVPENGSLPESAFKAKEITAPTKRVGTHIKISKRM